MEKKKKIMMIVIILIVGFCLFRFYPYDYMEKSQVNENEVGEGDKLPAPSGARPLAPPYCIKLGYEWRVITEEDGGQHGICKFPDGSECSEWAFFAGSCGVEWSYCEQHGYGIKIRKDRKDFYYPSGHVACVNKTTGEESGLVFDLMNLRQYI